MVCALVCLLLVSPWSPSCSRCELEHFICVRQSAAHPPAPLVRVAGARPAPVPVPVARAALKRKRTTNDLADPDGAFALSSAAELFGEEYTNALEHGVLGGGGGVGVLAAPAWFIPAMNLILTGTGNPIHTRLDAMDARMDARFDAVDARFDAVDARFDAVDARLDAMDAAMVARFQSPDREGHGP
jgi:hypothetical protein